MGSTQAEKDQARQMAATFVQALASVYNVLHGGKINFLGLLALAPTLATAGATIQAVTSGTAGLKGAFVAELIDLETGTDASALPFTVDVLPGMDPAQEEELFDDLKPMLEELGVKILDRKG